MRITVQISAETHSELQRRAEIMRRPVGWVAREAIEAWLAEGGERPTEAEMRRWIDDNSGVPSVLSGGDFPDMSAEEMLGGRTPVVPGPGESFSNVSDVRPTRERLAAARAVMREATERRGFETRTVGPNGMKLEIPIPGESYVDEND